MAPRLYKKKKRNEEVKLFDFVDSSKAIQGSSDEENEGKLSRSKKKRSKAAIQEDAEANSNEEQPDEEVDEHPAAAVPKSDVEMVEEDEPKPKKKKTDPQSVKIVKVAESTEKTSPLGKDSKKKKIAREKTGTKDAS